MTNRLFSGLALATLVVVGGLASSSPSVSAAPNRPVAPPTVLDTRALFQDASGMVALQQHAHVNMLLDGGHPARPSLASIKLPVDAVALTVPSVSR